MTDTDGLSVLYHTITLACQCLVYGMYIIIMPICSYVMLKRGLQRKSHILLFCMLVFMFSFSTAYGILSLYEDANLLATSFLHEVSHDVHMPLLNALVLLNKLFFTIRSKSSLLTNICSTSVVGIKAWRHRHWVISELQLKGKNITTAQRVFTLLVESGIIYCLSGLIVPITTVIRLPDGILGDLYTPVTVQFAGIYPAVVILLVHRQGELNKTVMFSLQGQDDALDVSNLGTIEYGDNPHVNSSFRETETSVADVTHNESHLSQA
ncbi:hypothetical protein ARMGADRAFT_1159441 [Armillaria gallica]|uniref:Uncharacterized protein n=1 Tax=Armillaria gallica TaxID=47427 RepID=A0A2H3E6A3_ARMGA|nr:hypothetical protein ARMGADRAFT_1159441 [Armillaria gallica]